MPLHPDEGGYVSPRPHGRDGIVPGERAHIMSPKEPYRPHELLVELTVEEVEFFTLVAKRYGYTDLGDYIRDRALGRLEIMEGEA